MEFIIWEYEVILTHCSPNNYLNSYLRIYIVKLSLLHKKETKDGFTVWQRFFPSKLGHVSPHSRLGFNLVARKICRWAWWAKDLFFSAVSPFVLTWRNWKAPYRGKEAHLKSCWLRVGGRPTTAGSGSILWRVRRAETLNFSKKM